MADTFVNVTWVADELVTSTKLNQAMANQANFHNGTALGDGIIASRHVSDGSLNDTKWRNGIAFKARQTTAQSMPGSTFTRINLQSVDYDLSGNFSSANSRFTAPVDGAYFLLGRIQWASVNGRTIAQFARSDGDTIRGQDITSSDVQGTVISTDMKLLKDQYVEFQGWRSTAGDTNVANSYSYFTGHLITRL